VWQPLSKPEQAVEAAEAAVGWQQLQQEEAAEAAVGWQ
jgi:hypothetical protein